MASKKGIEAGGAFVRIFADDSPLRRALDSARTRLKAFAQTAVGAGKILGGAFVAATAGALAATKSFANFADSVADASQRTGLSTQTLSELGYAAKLSASDMETLEKGFRTFTKGLVSRTNQKALEAIGLDAKTLQQQSPDQQLEALFGAFQQISNPTQRAAMAMQIFGKAGADLVPLLLASGDEIKAMREEAKKLGVSLTAEQAAAASNFNDALDKMGIALQGVSTIIGSALAPLLTYLADGVLIAAQAFSSWLASILKFVGSAKTAFATLDVAWAATTEFFGNAFSQAVEQVSIAVVSMQTMIEGVFDTVASNIQMFWTKALAAMVNETFAFARKASAPIEDMLRGMGLDDLANILKGQMIASGVGAPKMMAQSQAEVAKQGQDLEKRRQQREQDQAGIIANIQEDAAKAREARTKATIDAQSRLAEAMAEDQKRITEEAAKRAERAQIEAGLAFQAAGGGMEVAGTFSAQAIAGLGAQSLQQDMLNALQKVAANTDELVNEVAAGGLQ
jgi:hypothetical protein